MQSELENERVLPREELLNTAPTRERWTPQQNALTYGCTPNCQNKKE